MYKVNPWRPFAFLLGISAGAVGCFGAYEYGLGLEGGKISYLAIGAPIVAIMATIIPPLAEYAWRNNEPFKALLWWIALIPVGSMIFFSAAERVHMAKASNEAEITANYNAVVRARKTYDTASDALAKIEPEEAKAKAAKADNRCNLDCKTKLEYAEMLRTKFISAEIELKKAEKSSVVDSQWKPPVWLLPIALDIIAFMAVWTGLSGPWIFRAKVDGIPVLSKKQNMNMFARSNIFRFGNKEAA